jgi:hypothetical protein
VALYALHFHALRPGTAFRTVDIDPELAYFVSSVAVWNGQPYVLVQHPGTPVLVAGTAVTALLAPFLHWPGTLAGAFVARPELFVVPVHIVMLAGSLAVILALGRRLLSVRRRTDAVLAAALAAAYFAFLPGAFRWAFYWSHNAVAFAGGTALSLAILVAHRRARPVTTGTAAWLGLAGGALVATQLFFATWLVALAVTMAALPLMRDGRAGGRQAARLVVAAALGAAAAFALCFIPAIPGARVFVDFLRAFATHQGRYGGGPPGFTSWPVLRANLETLWGYSPALLAAEIATIAAVLAAMRGSIARRGWRAAGLGLVVQWTITVLLLAKHPSPFYVSALAALFPPLLAVAFALWRGRGPSARAACTVTAALVLAAAAAGLARDVAHDFRRNAFRAAMDREVADQRRRAAAARGIPADEVLVLWGPGLRDAGCYALWMGAQYSANALSREISRACPSEGLMWSNVVVVPEGWSARRGAAALVVTSESSPHLYPAFAALGPPAIGTHRDTEGLRLAFFDVTLDAGRVVPALALREVP